jgi:NADH-quinone oxidoreductase subunit C
MDAEETTLLNEIKLKFDVDGRVQNRQRIWVITDENKLIEISKWLKEHGFAHLSAISVTDWLKEGKYELTYHLWSYNDKMLVTVKTKIDRKNPVIKSVTPIWKESAQIHERELHELFGVKFVGNPDLSPLFLEDWRGPPPFRKDFDWREYVREKFYNKQNEREKVYYD